VFCRAHVLPARMRLHAPEWAWIQFYSSERDNFLFPRVPDRSASLSWVYGNYISSGIANFIILILTAAIYTTFRCCSDALLDESSIEISSGITRVMFLFELIDGINYPGNYVCNSVRWNSNLTLGSFFFFITDIPYWGMIRSIEMFDILIIEFTYNNSGDVFFSRVVSRLKC